MKLLLSIFSLFLCSVPAWAGSPTITDYWNGTAKLQFIRAYTSAEIQSGHITNLGPGFTGGARIKVVGNIWYLFTRRIETEIPVPDYCPQFKSNSFLLSTVVSKSTNEGLTWSKPEHIITPEANTAWECGATDGDAFYNAKVHQWHFLFQCLSRNGWQGCYANRSGEDPLGKFVTPTIEPVIPAGSLWAKICDSPSDKCFKSSGGYNKIHDEGTFDIFDYQDGYYFVDFHGYDGIHGYRGLAKTQDFQTWDVVAPDSTLDRSDALSFNTPWEKGEPVGFGAGMIIKDQGYYYLISEAADKNLGCTLGQHWVWGLFRTKIIDSANWEYYSNNPFFTAGNFPKQDPHPRPCNPAYAGFFSSYTGKVYFHVSLPSGDTKLDGIYLYELVFNNSSGTP